MMNSEKLQKLAKSYMLVKSGDLAEIFRVSQLVDRFTDAINSVAPYPLVDFTTEEAQALFLSGGFYDDGGHCARVGEYIERDFNDGYAHTWLAHGLDMYDFADEEPEALEICWVYESAVEQFAETFQDYTEVAEVIEEARKEALSILADQADLSGKTLL